MKHKAGPVENPIKFFYQSERSSLSSFHSSMTLELAFSRRIYCRLQVLEKSYKDIILIREDKLNQESLIHHITGFIECSQAQPHSEMRDEVICLYSSILEGDSDPGRLQDHKKFVEEVVQDAIPELKGKFQIKPSMPVLKLEDAQP
ncbi:MAG: hypothetical protein ACE5OZ_21780 [Candidatus Heimdallarchaeota archaeon]